MTVEELLAEQEIWARRWAIHHGDFIKAEAVGDLGRMRHWLQVQDECLQNMRHYSRVIAEQVEASSYGSRKNTPDVSGHAG